MPKRDIFAIVGLPPEVLAVAMAKYSRSTQSIRETIDELTEEKSADFHEKWVLGYGDASVADMAVLAIAVEGVSTLAAKAIEDARLASYQEKSSRYVAFDRSMMITPEAVAKGPWASFYADLTGRLMDGYQKLTNGMISYYRSILTPPEGLSDKLYEAKLKARSLDVSRYLQPTGLSTNFGLIMNARSLRHTISKLKGHYLLEVREIGAALQTAATEAAYNPQTKKTEEVLQKLETIVPDKSLVEALRASVKLQVKGAPTLIKHTDPTPYYADFNRYVYDLAREVLTPLGRPDSTPGAVLNEPVSMEDDLIITALFSQCHFSYRQIQSVVLAMSEQFKADIIRDLASLRGDHDWPRREYEVGQELVFDTLMIWGAFIDLQRHRMCTQINQAVTNIHGYEEPRDLAEAGLTEPYHELMLEASSGYDRLLADHPFDASYVITKGFYKRTLFKMNLRELFHMVELRTKPGGHFAYRLLVTQMFEAFRDKHPDIAATMRITKMDYLNEFFKR